MPFCLGRHRLIDGVLNQSKLSLGVGTLQLLSRAAWFRRQTQIYSGTRRLYQDVIADVPCRKEQEQTAHTVANRSERNDSEGPVLLISPAIWRPSYSMAA